MSASASAPILPEKEPCSEDVDAGPLDDGEADMQTGQALKRT
ncbi:MAG TPA: hypothetical protein VFB60_12975 [Ktedonobacteraceae bacterium]|nr:hypothetical protein [Ktedonobacteraceae bacterium]